MDIECTVAECSIGQTHDFKDESNLALSGKYFVGLFEKGKSQKVGVGRIVHKDNRLYEGMIRDGVCNGFGRLILPSGDHYVGYFKNDNLEGYAALYDIDGNLLDFDTYTKGRSQA